MIDADTTTPGGGAPRHRARRTARRATWKLVLLAGSVLAAVAPPQASADVPTLATRTVEVPVSLARSGAAPVRGYHLWVTTDGGSSWQQEPTLHPGPAIPYTAPRDGTYGFIVTPLDQAGHTPPPPQPGDEPQSRCVIDTLPPRLEVQRPEAGVSLYAGTDIAIEYRAFDDNFGESPIALEWRRGPEEPWRPVQGLGALPAVAREQWWAPVTDGFFALRLTARDRAGNETLWVTPSPIRVVPFDGFRGERTLASRPYTAFRKFPVHYLVRRFGPLARGQVEIWFRRGFEPWQRRLDPDQRTPFVFAAESDGEYFLYLRALDRNGLEDRPPPGPDTPFDLRVVVDTHSPEGRLIVGENEPVHPHRGGTELRIEWLVAEENLDQRACSLEVSPDGGTHWQELQAELDLDDGRGSLRWAPPLIESESMRFRLQLRDLAGNQTTVESPTRVLLLDARRDPTEVAQRHYERAVVLYHGAGGREADRSQLLRALENIEVALLYDGGFPEAWHDGGVIHALLGQPEEALESFRRAHTQRPGRIPFTFDLVRALLRMGDAGLDADAAHLDEARALLASVSTEEIYRYPHTEYRALLNTYRVLQTEVEERILEQ